MKISAVSIVVPCYNERAGLGPLLDMFEAQLKGSGVQFEYVIVDDGSTEATARRSRLASARRATTGS